MRKEDAIKRYGAYYTTEVSLEHPFGGVKEHLGRKPLVAKSNPNTVSDQYTSYNDARIAIEHSRIMFVLEDIYTSICDKYDQGSTLSLDDAAVAVIGVESSVNKPEESGCNEFNQATLHVLSTTDEEEMSVVLFSKDKAVEYLNNWEEKNPNVVTLNSERQKLLAFNG